jgi:predicted nucleotidyltransferase
MKTYQDWQKQSSDKADVLKACVAAIRRVVPEAEVILYGSVARGDERPDSDIDLLVLVPQEATYELKRAISDQIYAIELKHEQLINLIVRQRKKWNSEPLNISPLYHSIEREGVRM